MVVYFLVIVKYFISIILATFFFLFLFQLCLKLTNSAENSLFYVAVLKNVGEVVLKNQQEIEEVKKCFPSLGIKLNF